MTEKDISRLVKHYKETVSRVLARALLPTVHQRILRSHFLLQVVNLYIQGHLFFISPPKT